MSERPSIEHIQNIHVIDDVSGPPYVEIYMNIHHNGQACEPLTGEVFIQNDSYEDVRLLQKDYLEDGEIEIYSKFMAAVARLTYHE